MLCFFFGNCTTNYFMQYMQLYYGTRFKVSLMKNMGMIFFKSAVFFLANIKTKSASCGHTLALLIPYILI